MFVNYLQNNVIH